MPREIGHHKWIPRQSDTNNKDNLITAPLKPLVLAEMNPALNITFIQTPKELELLDEFFQKQAEKNDFTIGWDKETTPLKDYFFRRARTFQFGTLERQIVIDLLGMVDNDPEELFNVQGYYGKRILHGSGLHKLMKLIAPVTESNKWLKVGVNLGFEYQTAYWNFGSRTLGFYDCMMAEKCIWAGVKGMKQYSLYSMDAMMQQYFRLEIDKTLQESFTLDGVLSQDQINYAALDTRLPLGIKTVQGIIASGITLKALKAKNSPAVKFFAHLTPKVPNTDEPVVMGDKLNEIIQIENNAIGMFEDMHVHGERLDKERWLKRVAKSKTRLQELYATVLDPFFIPLVGDKNTVNTDAEIDIAVAAWKALNTISPEEIEIKSKMFKYKKTNPVLYAELDAKRLEHEGKRKAKKEELKKKASDMSKKRTKVKNLAVKCEANALINYSSDIQLMAVLKEIKGLKSLKSMDDETLEKYEHFPVMKAIRELHGLQKEIGTYGDQWAQEWTTKPCKEEGWLNPGDGRLHCVFNQYDAETGRSSSEKPNGQNLPQDKEVRSCFVADPPNENIRVSNCCEADTITKIGDVGLSNVWCSECEQICSTHAEEYVIITADMSGAELRIIAELAQDPIWIGAFNRGEDVHSVGTEILHEAGWRDVTLKSLKTPEVWLLSTCNPKRGGEVVIEVAQDDGKVKLIGPCAYYAVRDDNGEVARQKCDCPTHQILRNDNKATNFLLAYGGGPDKLSKSIKKTLKKAQELMALHEKKFPRIWAYLKTSGEQARMKKKSFDMYGRRRIFPEPTYTVAKEKFINDPKNEKFLRSDEVEGQAKVALFIAYHNRKPDDDELFDLTHRQPTSKEVNKTIGALSGGIERQGKNHSIQGTNATIIKLAGGCGYDANGKPYLWHIFPSYRALLLKMVHDELVVQSPKHKAKKVAEEIGGAFKRAAAVKMKSVVMEFDYNINGFWDKG